jgi:hypothetical protein
VRTQAQFQLSVDFDYYLSSAMQIYDYLLTLPLEIDYFWSRPLWKFNAIMFYGTRYIALFGSIPGVFYPILERTLLESAVRSPQMEHVLEYVANFRARY